MLPTGASEMKRAGEPHLPPRDWPATRTADGRLRLVHGPIDLIFDLVGPAPEVALAEAAARRAFAGILEALVAELPLLRAGVTPASPDPAGPVAREAPRAVTAGPAGPRSSTALPAPLVAVAEAAGASSRRSSTLTVKPGPVATVATARSGSASEPA